MRSEPKEPRPARAPRVLLCEPQYHCSVELVTKRTMSNQDRGKCVRFHNMHRLFILPKKVTRSAWERLPTPKGSESQMVFRNAISAFLSSAERSSPKA